VLLGFAEAKAHEEVTDLDALRRAEPRFADYVEAKLDRARREFFL